MSKHRTRHRARAAVQPVVLTREQQDQADVTDQAAELGTLWRALPYAVARDSRGQLSKDKAGDRQSAGAAGGSSATVNIAVVDAQALVETGLSGFAAEAVPILNLERVHRPAQSLIEALPDWHRALAASQHGQPLAKQLRRWLPSWLTSVRLAVRVQEPDVPLGPLCPEHRDTAPGKLLIVGARATLARSLLDGPPDPILLVAGPACPPGIYTDDCHEVCGLIRESRIVDGHGRPTDWVWRDDAPAWSSLTGDLAWTWQHTAAVRCPKCKKRWVTAGERRILARELAALGDKRPQELAT